MTKNWKCIWDSILGPGLYTQTHTPTPRHTHTYIFTYSLTSTPTDTYLFPYFNSLMLDPLPLGGFLKWPSSDCTFTWGCTFFSFKFLQVNIMVASCYCSGLVPFTVLLDLSTENKLLTLRTDQPASIIRVTHDMNKAVIASGKSRLTSRFRHYQCILYCCSIPIY